jgi:hypothetical protein
MNYLLGQFKVDLKLWKQVVTSGTASRSRHAFSKSLAQSGQPRRDIFLV